MWSFTGGCHYTLGCNNFIKGCSKCPQLGSNFKYDISYFLFQKKQKILRKKNIFFCTISKWLADSAKKSAILKKEKILNMNNHVDTKNFYPLSKKISRKKLKINTNKKIIIYGAENIEAKYKGYDKFIDTLDHLNSKEYMILLFGKMWNFSKLREKKIEFKYLGYVSNKNKLRTIYNAGDLFAISSLQDAFPKTFAEAMLCEVPIVSFQNTSIARVNLHKKTGYNAKSFDPKDFAKGINYVAKKKNLGKKGRKLILQKYNPNLITKNYINLYKKILHEKI